MRNFSSRYCITPRDVFDEPIEWRIEDDTGKFLCSVHDEETAQLIVDALNAFTPRKKLDRAWLHENKVGFDAYNERVKTHGIFSETVATWNNFAEEHGVKAKKKKKKKKKR